jgi:hypothetical protein
MQQNPNLFAGLGPFAGLAQAGSQLATRGIQGLFGIKDPVLERNRILSQLNYDDPESIRAAAQALMAQGDIEAGMQLANQARQIQQQERQYSLQQRGVELQEKAGERAAKTLTLQEEKAFLDKLDKSPRAALADIVAMEDGPKKNMLLAQASQSMDAARLNEDYKQAQIDALKAQARTAGQKGYELIKDTMGNPVARFNKGTGEIEDMPGVKAGGGGGTGDAGKLSVGDVKGLLAGTPGAKSAAEPSTGVRSSAGQMGRNRAAQARGIPEPPPRTTRGGRSNPAYEEWDRLYGAAYRAQMAGQ